MKLRWFSVLLLAAIANATTIVPVSIEKMARDSDVVVRGRALSERSEWNAERTRIYTFTTFAVLETWKGDQRRTVVVRQMGGTRDGYVQRAVGVRGWRKGEESVLFLKRKGDAMQITALVQGDFRVSGDAVNNSAADVQSFDPGSRNLRSYRGQRMTIQQLRTRVRKAVQE